MEKSEFRVLIKCGFLMGKKPFQVKNDRKVLLRKVPVESNRLAMVCELLRSLHKYEIYE